MLAEYNANSQLTLPYAIVNKLGLSVGDMLDITEKDGGIFISPALIISKSQQKKMSNKGYQYVLDELCGCIDDSTFVEPPEIPWEYDTPTEEIL
jgi:bifunctional DNA-binding transcriptional regulator/antitoxin component of YhaV-PrlF toxin-antitoxin module